MRRSVLTMRLLDQVRSRRLDQDVDALGCARSAFGVADDPAHGIAGGDGAGADELLARLERDVGDLAWRCIDLVERPLGERIDLDRVEVTRARRLHTRFAIGLVDARARIGGLGRLGLRARQRLKLAGQGQELGNLDDLHRLRRIGLQHRPARRVVVGDLRRLPRRRAGAERRSRNQNDGEGREAHQPSSLDQLRAWT